MDERYLYLGADVSDDHPLLNDSTGGDSIFDGSCVVLLLRGTGVAGHPPDWFCPAWRRSSSG